MVFWNQAHSVKCFFTFIFQNYLLFNCWNTNWAWQLSRNLWTPEKDARPEWWPEESFAVTESIPKQRDRCLMHEIRESSFSGHGAPVRLEKKHLVRVVMLGRSLDPAAATVSTERSSLLFPPSISSRYTAPTPGSALLCWKGMPGCGRAHFFQDGASYSSYGTRYMVYTVISFSMFSQDGKMGRAVRIGRWWSVQFISIYSRADGKPDFLPNTKPRIRNKSRHAKQFLMQCETFLWLNFVPRSTEYGVIDRQEENLSLQMISQSF
jgi:hypothetical protein